MVKTMKNLKKISVCKKTTIKDAINIFGTYEGLRMVIVVDDDKKFLGVLTDPDIRRGLVRGLTLENTIENIFQKNPITANINDNKQKLIELSAKHNIYEIPILDDNGHVIDIKSISNLLKSNQYDNKIIIMAGGLGKRLRPLTNHIPKPMLKVGSKPILHIILDRVKMQGFKKIIICVNYKHHVIENYFKDGSKFDLEIEYIKENIALGTAGALGLINNIGDKPFVVMNGDILSDINFLNMINFHNENFADATMGVREFNYQVPYGVIDIDKNCKVKNIIEKPIKKFLVSAGIYILNPNVLEIIPKNIFLDMPNLFDLLIDRKQKVYSHLINEYWIDIGRHEEYERAHMEIK